MEILQASWRSLTISVLFIFVDLQREDVDGQFGVLLESVRRALEEALTHSPVLQINSSKDQ